ADTSGGLPLAALNTLVSESVDVVVHCTRTARGPRVTEVALVEDLAGGAEATHFTVTEVFRRARGEAPPAWDGRGAGPGGRALGGPVRRRPEAAHDAGGLLDPQGVGP